MNNYIVFTDLDGTLLDHHTYSYEAARPGLDFLKANNIPLILVSSKTYDEMILLHDELGLSGPFIFENGGGIAWKEEKGALSPNEPNIEITGRSADELMELFTRVEEIFKFKGTPLAAMTPEEIAKTTGLPLDRARRAGMRRASLPFLIDDDSPVQEIDLIHGQKKLQALSLSLTRGGRFYHLIGNRTSKGRAVKMVLDRIGKIYNGEPITTVGIGDSENDLAMLEAVTIPFLVRRHDGTHQKTTQPGIRFTDAAGPGGFSEAIKSL